MAASLFFWEKTRWVSIDQLPFTAIERSFWHGDGLFTTLRIAHGKVENGAAHIERLTQQCSQIAIVWEGIEVAALHHLISLCSAQRGLWRLKLAVSGGRVVQGLEALRLPKREGFLLAQVGPQLSPREDAREQSLALTAISNSLSPFASRLKSLSHLERLYLREDALRRGFDDLLLYDGCSGVALETSCAALLWFEGELLCYPAEELPLLASTSSALLRRALAHNGLPPPRALHRAVEQLTGPLFAINALRGIQPINSIDGRLLQRSPPLEALLHSTLARALTADS